MTRREVSWRLEMAAEKMKRRGLVAGNSSQVDTKAEFTEEESKTLTSALVGAQERVRERFSKK